MCESIKTEKTLHVFAMPTGEESIDILAKALASCQRDLADRDAEIATLKRARDNQADTITKCQARDKRQLERIATLERSNQARWERIQEVERLADSRLEQLQAREAAHTSDHLELVARREECEKLGAEVSDLRRVNAVLVESRDRAQAELASKRGECELLDVEVEVALESLRLMTADRDEWRQVAENNRVACRIEQQGKIAARDQRDQEALARQRAQIELDTLRNHSTQQAETLGGYLTEIESLKGALDKEIARVAELQEHGADQYQEILSLRHDVAERAQREGRVAAMLSAAPECHCDDLQEQLANLHRSGKALIDSLDGSPMPYGLVAFIQSHTRAGDALEEINSL